MRPTAWPIFIEPPLEGSGDSTALIFSLYLMQEEGHLGDARVLPDDAEVPPAAAGSAYGRAPTW